MITADRLQQVLDAIKQEVWAIVYAYNPPRAPRALWYDRWRYDVINDHVEAVSFLGAEPLIIDIDSFIVSDRLRSGEIDRVINLNSGATPIQNTGVVPSIAAWYQAGHFPNTADAVMAGERKDLCKSFFSRWFNIPRSIDFEDAEAGRVPFIVKPKTMGNSQFVTQTLPSELVTRQERARWLRDMMIEEFIEGYELTVPVVFDAVSDDYLVFQPITYLPEVPDPPSWFMSHEEKMNRFSGIERRIGLLGEDAIDAIRKSSHAYGFGDIARFDFRLRTKFLDDNPAELAQLWFLEINCMPTLRTDVNFLKAVGAYLATHDDPVIDAVRDANSPDISALAYLLLQSRLAAHDQMKK